MRPLPRVFSSILLFYFYGVVYAVDGATGRREPQAAAANERSTAGSAQLDALHAVQPLLAEINQAVSSIEVRRWKVPGEVKDTTVSDVQSIQKDLDATLPGLIEQAVAAPDAIAPAFAVFRNIDALYDVLLRITETATLAGTQAEADRLEKAQAQLQARRSQLGSAILDGAMTRDAEVVKMRIQLQAAAQAAAAAPPKKIVVNDGPEPGSAKPIHRKKPPAAVAAPQSPSPPNATPPAR